MSRQIRGTGADYHKFFAERDADIGVYVYVYLFAGGTERVSTEKKGKWKDEFATGTLFH